MKNFHWFLQLQVLNEMVPDWLAAATKDIYHIRTHEANWRF